MLFSNTTLPIQRKYGVESAVRMMIEEGYPAIDISMLDTKGEIFGDGYAALADKLLGISDESGVKYVQAHAPFGGGCKNYLDNLVPLFPRAFEFCARVGIDTIVVHPIQDGRYYGNEERLYDANMRFYSALMPLARTNGVRIGIENMWMRHPVTGHICDDVCAPPEELVRYYDSLGDPDVFTICLDTGHVALCGREPEDAIRAIGHDRLGALHVHDVDYVTDLHTVPGAGKINWDNVCRALGEIDYVGVFNMEVESFYGNLPEEHYPAITRYMAETARVLSDKVDLYRMK